MELLASSIQNSNCLRLGSVAPGVNLDPMGPSGSHERYVITVSYRSYHLMIEIDLSVDIIIALFWPNLEGDSDFGSVEGFLIATPTDSDAGAEKEQRAKRGESCGFVHAGFLPHVMPRRPRRNTAGSWTRASGKER